MRVTLLSGGTGTPKLLQGFLEILPPDKISVVVNTGEDLWLSHGYFSPDLDTVLYTAAGIVNEETWYGIAGDTFFTNEQLKRLGFNEYLRIGDRDRATHIFRGKLLKEGLTLEEATHRIAKALGVEINVIPMSNERVETVIATRDGEMNLQEFLVLRKAKPEIVKVYYRGIERAKLCKGAAKAIARADIVIIGPSNPVTSIAPIINLIGTRELLEKNRDKVVAVSPVVGKKAVSGPAVEMLRAQGYEASPKGVASFYAGIISKFVVNLGDYFEMKGLEVYERNIIMRNLSDKIELARFLMELMECTT